MKIILNSRILDSIELIKKSSSTHSSKKELLKLIDYINNKINLDKEININFICTHNSRRSIFSQIWAKVFSDYYGLQKVRTFSGGTESTYVSQNVIKTLSSYGFIINKLDQKKNSNYEITYSSSKNKILIFSKKYDEISNPKKNFVAVTTCLSAKENCPFISGSEKIISLSYDDPKKYDKISEPIKMYLNISNQIATDMNFVFSNLKI